MDSQDNKFATSSLKGLGASNSVVKEVHELKSLNASSEKLLTESIKFLSQYGNQFVQKFAIDIDIMMRYLTERLPSNEHFILWTKYYNLAIPIKAKLPKNDKEKDDQFFDEIQAKFVETYSLHQDWRVVLKLRQLGSFFNLKGSQEDSKIILDGFKERLISSLEFIVWHDEIPYFLKYTKQILTSLYAMIQDSKNEEIILNSILNGRFDKGGFLDKSLIVGEDGGLYALLTY